MVVDSTSENTTFCSSELDLNAMGSRIEIWQLREQHVVPDQRVRHFFYRADDAVPSADEQPSGLGGHGLKPMLEGVVVNIGYVKAENRGTGPIKCVPCLPVTTRRSPTEDTERHRHLSEAMTEKPHRLRTR